MVNKKGKQQEGEVYIAGSVGKRSSVSILENANRGLRNALNLQEKNPEFESENYKIDNDMSVQEKLQHGRTKERGRMYYMPHGKNMEHIAITMLIKDIGKGAYVVEYLPNDIYFKGEQPKNSHYFDNGGFIGLAAMSFIPQRYDSDMPKEYIGTQKFNYAAAKQLGLIKKMPRDVNAFRKACGAGTPAEILKEHFSKDGKPQLTGSVNLKDHSYSSVDDHETFLLGNGQGVVCNDTIIVPSNMPPMVAASIRLFKKSKKSLPNKVLESGSN